MAHPSIRSMLSELNHAKQYAETNEYRNMLAAYEMASFIYAALSREARYYPAKINELRDIWNVETDKIVNALKSGTNPYKWYETRGH